MVTHDNNESKRFSDDYIREANKILTQEISDFLQQAQDYQVKNKSYLDFLKTQLY